jgi:NAD(P)H-binding
MDFKIAGESIVRDLYAARGGPGLAYSIVRPGGLNDKPSVGSSMVHVSQGDVYSSEIPREDVALVTVATLLKGQGTDFTTFELNQVEGLGKAMKTLPDLPSELVHAGAKSFDGLLDGLLTDKSIKQKYPEIISGFRGEGVPPIDKLLTQA